MGSSGKTKTKDQYVLAERIARGGMAEIYLGKAVGKDAFQRIVAIKRILPHYSQDKEYVEMFRDEAHICKRLQHANIVQVYDFTEVKGSYALVMEHIDGADFKTLLAKCEEANRRLSVPMSLYIIANVAKGLHYAHTKVDEVNGKLLGIVHRDVSPQNILLSYEGEVKITDFGIAAADNKNQETRPGVVKGKYTYMSPEQVQAKPLDRRSDIFSLSIVLWEALAMKRLFAGKTEVQTIKKVQNCEIPLKLTDLNKEVSRELMELVHKGLEKDPKKRFQTGAEFAKAILKYLHSKYPEFLSSELGDFLKQILAERRGKSQEVIKKALTSSTQEPHIEAVQPTSSEKEARSGQPKSRVIDSISIDLSEKSGITVTPSMKSVAQTRHSKLQRLDSKIHHRPRQKKPSKGKLITLTIALALVVTTIIYKNRSKLFPSDNTITLTTDPSRVQIFVDGKNLRRSRNKTFKGVPEFSKPNRNGVHTIRVKTNKKAYQVVIRRPGYKSQKLEMRAGGSEVVVLKRLRESFATINIVSNQSLNINVDNGFAEGSSPLTVPFLNLKAQHIVEYVTKNNKKGVCRLTKQKLRQGKYTLKIDHSASPDKRCRLRKH